MARKVLPRFEPVKEEWKFRKGFKEVVEKIMKKVETDAMFANLESKMQELITQVNEVVVTAMATELCKGFFLRYSHKNDIICKISTRS